ncbi:4857_t:CDS:2, partial [Racocetra fulgida]
NEIPTNDDAKEWYIKNYAPAKEGHQPMTTHKGLRQTSTPTPKNDDTNNHDAQER